MKGFRPLASGSKGNCLYVGTSHTKVLIDMGIGIRQLTERLASCNVDLSDIDAVLITHEHHDHIAGLRSLVQKYGIPVFANVETAKGIVESLKGECLPFKIFATGETFEWKDLEIHPFSIPHDTSDPVAFILRTGGIKLGVCADLGYVTSLVGNKLQQCDYLYLEANHQPEMVHACSRPAYLKQRILGRSGHLSNAACAELLYQVYHPGVKHVYLAHLSEECNHPDLAMLTVQNRLRQHPELCEKTVMTIAKQNEPSDFVAF